MLCLYITFFFDPGYLESPLNCEGCIIYNQSIAYSSKGMGLLKERSEFLTQFSSLAANGPLVRNEYIQIKHTLNSYLNPKHSDSISITTGEKDDIPDVITLCANCLRWKSERTHHCKRCDKCVRRMDHHCPWVANCIGENNYKSFCLTIFYGMIPSGGIVFTHWEYLFIITISPETSNLLCIWNTFAYICNMIFFAFLVYLFYSNIVLIIGNYTTIEREEMQRYELLNQYKAKSTIKHKYDIGIWNNIKEVFGENPLIWFIPCNYGRRRRDYYNPLV